VLAALGGLLALRLGLALEGGVRAEGGLTITAPRSAISLVPGAFLTLAWSDTRLASSPVFVYLKRSDTGALREIGSNLRSTGDSSRDVYDWLVTSDVAPGSYTLVLRSFDGMLESVSAPVEVGTGVAGQVRVLVPPSWAGQLPTFALGQAVDVHWDYPLGAPRAVGLTLDIYDYGRWAGSREIARGVLPVQDTFASATHFSWTVGSLQRCNPPEARFRIRIATADGTVGQSADFFLLTGVGSVDTSGCLGLPDPAPTPTPTPTPPPTPTPTPTPTPAPAPANLIANPSFEQRGAGIPGWTTKVEAPALAAVVLDTAVTFEGATSLRFDIQQPPPADQPWLLQLSSTSPLPLRSDRRYNLSFAARGERAGQLEVLLQENQPPWKVFYDGRVAVGGDWARTTLDLDGGALPPTGQPVALRLNLPLSGKAWFDDVRYVESVSSPPDPADPQPTGPAGPWRLLFRDEFTAPPLDASRWVNCYLWDPYGCFKTFGGEAEWYLPQNVSVEDGSLRILARRETQPIVGPDGSRNPFSSGIVSTGKDHGKTDPAVSPRFAFRYGFVEARLKLPRNPGEPRNSVGFWPAFWMLPVQSNPQVASQGDYEYDILEMFGQPERAYMTVHWPSPDGSFSQDGSFFDVPPPDFTDDFHVFGLEWQEGSITWYVDGQPRKTYSDPSRLYHGPMYVLLNLAIGGFSGDPERATFPAEMGADYVRVWQRP